MEFGEILRTSLGPRFIAAHQSCLVTLAELEELKLPCELLLFSLLCVVVFQDSFDLGVKLLHLPAVSLQLGEDEFEHAHARGWLVELGEILD